jgi:hypothetical protein
MWRLIPVGAVLLAAAPALAQRGGDFVRRETPPADATTGFPGLLDTNLAERGKLVLDAPLLSARYGVTGNWTIGANTLTLLPLLGGRVSGLVETRYRLRSCATLTWVISAYGGVSGIDYEDDLERPHELRLALGMIVSNVAYRITPRDQLTASFAFARMNANVARETSDGDSVVIERNHAIAVLTALTYQHAFGTKVALSASAIAAPVIAGENDSASSTVEISFRGPLYERLLARGMVHYRRGRWLLGAGAFVAVVRPIPIPWLALAWSPA